MSEVKVNKISPRTACGTVTLGDSGDTFTIPSGATITNAGTASGFGATGETSWDTTVKTTGTFTATAGVGYFLNTTGGIITVNLPVGAAGSSVALADYAGTWQTNNVTLSPNGSENIGGQNDNVTLSTEGQSVTFVYIDGTQGWVNVLDSTSNVRANPYIIATGGTPCAGVISGDYKTHIFTGPGTFCVASLATCSANDVVDYMVVAGGASAGRYIAGGGGAGGVRTFTTLTPANPINAPAGVTVSASPYTITVGGGGAGAGPAGCAGPSTQACGSPGNPSTFSTITSAGGGGGGQCGCIGLPGGSGGGAGGRAAVAAGNGNDPATPVAQGTNGGANPGSPGCLGGGGGGGSTTVGGISPGVKFGGTGGTGAFLNDSFFGPTAPSYGQAPSPLAPNGRYFGGGGGGGGWDSPTPGGPLDNGGAGGGGSGTTSAPGGAGPGNTVGEAGSTNTGGGGGSAGVSSGFGNQPGAGGSGIVLIRYKFQ